MQVQDFDYHLPEELIAQEPRASRDQSRLFVVQPATQTLSHRHFWQLPEYLAPGDVLVLNQTKVIPARLLGRRRDTGGKVEVFLLRSQEDPLVWEALVKPGRRVKPGVTLVFSAENSELTAEVLGITGSGSRWLRFKYFNEKQGNFSAVLEKFGQIPLPPYIHRTPDTQDQERYQTVYAREAGSVAAPTAGLHFTPELLAQLQQQGVIIASLVLHVGLGTFRPVKTETVEAHQMHAEYYQVLPETAALINTQRQQGGRVIAVGTTSARVLETVTNAQGEVMPKQGWTDIFIYPGYVFKGIDGLITNFHLPRSTLLMLTCAFGGKDLVLKAYAEAVAQKYRFFSYGDAMLLL